MRPKFDAGGDVGVIHSGEVGETRVGRDGKGEVTGFHSAGGMETSEKGAIDGDAEEVGEQPVGYLGLGVFVGREGGSDAEDVHLGRNSVSLRKLKERELG